MRYVLILMLALLTRPAFGSVFVCSFFAVDEGRQVTVLANFSEAPGRFPQLTYLGSYQTISGVYPAYCHSGEAGSLLCEPALSDQPMAYFLRDTGSAWRIAAKGDAGGTTQSCEIVRP